jgi:uncharacterized membrane protein YbhN (UPF0104 family)
MRIAVRKWWPLLKAVFAIAILAAIGREFWRVLRGGPSLWQQSVHPQWLILSGVLYILGLGFSAVYWYRLLRLSGQHPSFMSAVRAHYIGQMGKYLPGKAWALVLRCSVLQGLSMRVGIVTSFYEVLTTMAGGAFLAAVLFALESDVTSSRFEWSALHELITFQASATPILDHKVIAVLALLLLVVIGVPILPPVFNRIVYWLTPKVEGSEDTPGIRTNALLHGLALTSGTWIMFGASLWAVLRAIVPNPLPLTLERWEQYTAYMALAYVAGFIILLVPSGLGVREFFLTLFLVPELHRLDPEFYRLDPEAAPKTVVVAVIALRLVWTAMELIVVGLVYWLPVGRSGPAALPAASTDSRT